MICHNVLSGLTADWLQEVCYNVAEELPAPCNYLMERPLLLTAVMRPVQCAIIFMHLGNGGTHYDAFGSFTLMHQATSRLSLLCFSGGMDHGLFTPFVTSTFSGLGREATVFIAV